MQQNNHFKLIILFNIIFIFIYIDFVGIIIILIITYIIKAKLNCLNFLYKSFLCHQFKIISINIYSYKEIFIKRISVRKLILLSSIFK